MKIEQALAILVMSELTSVQNTLHQEYVDASQYVGMGFTETEGEIVANQDGTPEQQARFDRLERAENALHSIMFLLKQFNNPSFVDEGRVPLNKKATEMSRAEIIDYIEKRRPYMKKGSKDFYGQKTRVPPRKPGKLDPNYSPIVEVTKEEQQEALNKILNQPDIKEQLLIKLFSAMSQEQFDTLKQKVLPTP